jgi:hypothetical protein
MPGSGPELIFFRERPAGWLENPPLPGALQAFETSLLALALGRFPTALVLCVSSLEALLKSHLRPVPTEEKPKVPSRYLRDLWAEVAQANPRVASFPTSQVEKLIHKRNRMAHYGHAPTDNPACAELLLDVGYPLFTAILADCFRFHLDWRAVQPDARDILALTENQRECCGLLADAAKHWRSAFQLRAMKSVPALACFHGLMHYIRRYIQPTFTSRVEEAVSDAASEHGLQFEIRQKQLRKVSSLFSHCWLSDCPYCDEIQSLALDLCFSATEQKVGVRRARCVSCDFSLPEIEGLGSVLFSEQLAKDLPRILQEYGPDE